ncbi:S1-like domain-containing RNA-binding protein [Sanyastnella coralliicola]|uniref:S1-like domain-containing RNA-binding protein n=1 Tax=Sanyastnella coralliicola TaxID=3069118 RepID=UPI0027BA96F0|nr:S1-like domain-containing RNA-binding protein [Longitalea sp. SCSIO 12813]
MFVTPGSVYNLPIARIERNMAYVDAFGRAIELPLREINAGEKPGDIVEVFIYTDRQREWKCTREMPAVKVGDIAFLRVGEVANGIGFANVGLEDDLPIFEDQQLEPMRSGNRYYLTMIYDEMEERLLGSSKIYRLAQDDPPYEQGEKVKFFIIEKVDNGRKVMIDQKYIAFLHDSDMLPGCRRGDTYVGYIRENEGRNFRITMYGSGREKVEEAAKKIMDMLEVHRGYIRLTDNTPAEEINLRLRMSKTTFKQAVGKLYKEEKITITPRGIKLNRAK